MPRENIYKGKNCKDILPRDNITNGKYYQGKTSSREKNCKEQAEAKRKAQEEAERKRKWLKLPRNARIAIRRLHNEWGHKPKGVLKAILKASNASFVTYLVL